MKNTLNQLEKDFIEFISKKKNCSYSESEGLFCGIKKRFNRFKGSEYEKFSGNIQGLFRIYYDVCDEYSAIEAYQYFALLHLFRYISYSYTKSAADYLHESIKIIKKKQLKQFCILVGRQLTCRLKKRPVAGPCGYVSLARSLVDKVEGHPIVVDYGSGLGYISFEIAKLDNSTKVYLVDIDGIVLEFAEFRFRKNGMKVEVIPVTKDCIYPKLPNHNICIATEVMEHLYQPLSALQNINAAMASNGILYGNFEDHDKGVFHVSGDLSDLRTMVEQNFKNEEYRYYRKT
jgi:2-polyprenyl-3-methyl-5-hydroxy-6-metoxy-1,4-benzoquinol methylase